MRPLLVALSSIGLSFGLASAVHADVPPPQPVEPAPAEALEGELHVALKNTDYVKVTVNGEEWETIEFEHKGKDLIVKGLKLTQERNALVLLPHDATLAPFTLDVLTKDFKKKFTGKFYIMTASKTVTFAKAATIEPTTPGTPGTPGTEPKKPDPIAPPPEKHDDL